MSKPVDLNAQTLKIIYDEADCLCDATELDRCIARMSEEIASQLSENLPLVLVVMNGGLVFAGKILPQLGFPLQLDYIHVSRYRQNTQGGELDWLVQPKTSLAGRHILILDDILDEGHTLQAIVRHCENAGAVSVKTAVLVDKVHDRKAVPDLKADFEGVRVPDRFVFGFGMDYQGYWRNAPGIFAVKGL